MRLVLLSLFSREDNSGGLAVYDLDSSSARYVHLIDFSGLPGRICHMRGVHWLGDTLYAVSPFALFLFRPGQDRKGPGLILEKTVILREWLLGQGQQGNLHAVHASSETGCVYVSFNSQSAIDSFDLKGNFLNRRHLWEIAPDLFPLPDRVPKDKTFRFGIVRHIFTDHKYGLVLTTSFVNESSHGALLAGDTGTTLLATPFNPHGCIAHQEALYLTDIDAGLVHVYPMPILTQSASPCSTLTFHPVTDDSRWPGSVQNVRGITVLHDRLICGVCHFGKVKPTQVPPRLVEFDLNSGDQKAEHLLPDFSGLHGAQVYAITPVPEWLTEMVTTWDEPRYFLGNNQFTPEVNNQSSYSNENDGSKTKDSMGIGSSPLFPGTQIKTTQISSATQDEHIDFELKAPGEPNIRDNGPPVAKPSIVLQNVGLCFVRKARSLFGLNKHLKKNRPYWALHNVSFVLHEGESVGVIGRNGSGKSSLSLICAAVYKPDYGQVIIHGRAHLLALGVGFKAELTGRENVFISASLLGMSRKEILRVLPDIEAFAELGGFMDEPVRTYSSGMRSKLGFAVATAVEPEILILDEAMSVGDKAFQDKAMARMRIMREKAKSVLVVSHNPGQLRKLCTRVVWMEQGRVMMDGEPGQVLHSYENFCQNPQKWLERHDGLNLGHASDAVVKNA